MTVFQLIHKLAAFDGNKPVVVLTDNDDDAYTAAITDVQSDEEDLCVELMWE